MKTRDAYLEGKEKRKQFFPSQKF